MPADCLPMLPLRAGGSAAGASARGRRASTWRPREAQHTAMGGGGASRGHRSLRLLLPPCLLAVLPLAVAVRCAAASSSPVCSASSYRGSLLPCAVLLLPLPLQMLRASSSHQRRRGAPRLRSPRSRRAPQRCRVQGAQWRWQRDW